MCYIYGIYLWYLCRCFINSSDKQEEFDRLIYNILVFFEKKEKITPFSHHLLYCAIFVHQVSPTLTCLETLARSVGWETFGSFWVTTFYLPRLLLGALSRNSLPPSGTRYTWGNVERIAMLNDLFVLICIVVAELYRNFITTAVIASLLSVYLSFSFQI